MWIIAEKSPMFTWKKMFFRVNNSPKTPYYSREKRMLNFRVNNRQKLSYYSVENIIFFLAWMIDQKSSIIHAKKIFSLNNNSQIKFCYSREKYIFFARIIVPKNPFIHAKKNLIYFRVNIIHKRAIIHGINDIIISHE